MSKMNMENKLGKIYKLVVRKTMLQAKGSQVIDMLTNGSKIVGEVILKYDDSLNRLVAFLDSDEKANAIGMVEEISDDKGDTFIVDAVKESLKIGYKAEIVALGEIPNTFNIKYTEILPYIAERKTSGTFDDEIKRVVESGYCTEAEARERINVMKDLYLPDNMIIDILKKYRKYKKPVKRPSTIFVDPYGEEAGMIRLAMINILIGRAQIFEGPKSVGKNVAVETIAWILNMPMYLITFNRYMCGDDVYGTKTTVPPEINTYSTEELETMSLSKLKAGLGIKISDDELAQAAKFEALSAKASAVCIQQEESQLVEALADGGLMCFNEMNMAEANFFSSFTNQITDGTGFLFVPGVGRININPDFVLIGTQNGGYLGTNEQNDATISRFANLTFTFPGSVKNQLKAAVGTAILGAKYFDQCDALYIELLRAVNNGNIQDTCLNIRGFVAALKAVAAYPEYTKLSQQLQIQVINVCPETERPTLLAQLSDKINL